MRARIRGYRGTPPNPRDTLYRRGHARVDLSLYLHLSLLSPYGGGERWKTYRFRHDHPIHPAIARDLRVCITGRSRRTDGAERHGIPYDRLCEGTGVSPDTSHVRQAGKYQSYFAQPVRLRTIRHRGKSHRL